MELSKRLKAVAGLVTEGASVADIGTDHGYVPIWLIQSGRAAKVIAMDVNEGPLERSRGHIRSKRLENGYRSVEEDMVEEDGKYYPMMKLVHG